MTTRNGPCHTAMASGPHDFGKHEAMLDMRLSFPRRIFSTVMHGAVRLGRSWGHSSCILGRTLLGSLASKPCHLVTFGDSSQHRQYLCPSPTFLTCVPHLRPSPASLTWSSFERWLISQWSQRRGQTASSTVIKPRPHPFASPNQHTLQHTLTITHLPLHISSIQLFDVSYKPLIRET
jgi:hypothetical protein